MRALGSVCVCLDNQPSNLSPGLAERARAPVRAHYCAESLAVGRLTLIARRRRDEENEEREP